MGVMSAFYRISFYFSCSLHICLSSVCCHLMRTVIFCMCICMLFQSISVFSLAVFLSASLPEIKWMMIRVTLDPLYRFGPLPPGIAGAADGWLRHWISGGRAVSTDICRGADRPCVRPSVRPSHRSRSSHLRTIRTSAGRRLGSLIIGSATGNASSPSRPRGRPTFGLTVATPIRR